MTNIIDDIECTLEDVENQVADIEMKIDVIIGLLKKK